VLRVTESVEHLPPGIDRRLIEAAGALRIHDPIVAAVADEERAFDLVGAAVQRVVAKFFPRVGEIARADDPPDAILNRRIVVEEIEETSAAPECPPRSSPRS
jgi:hypothetical protein